MTGKTVSLLVLSGIHAGARAGLVRNETKIGHGESCDLIFSDQNIQNTHCRIVLEDGKILIYRQDGDVTLYDKSIDMAEVVIGTTFSIGDVQIAIVDDDTDINDLSADKAPSPVIEDSSMMPYEPTLTKTIDVDDYEREYEEEETTHGKSDRRTRWRFALISASAAFVIVLGLLAWELLSVASTPTKGTLEKNPRAFQD